MSLLFSPQKTDLTGSIVYAPTKRYVRPDVAGKVLRTADGYASASSAPSAPQRPGTSHAPGARASRLHEKLPPAAAAPALVPAAGAFEPEGGGALDLEYGDPLDDSVAQVHAAGLFGSEEAARERAELLRQLQAAHARSMVAQRFYGDSMLPQMPSMPAPAETRGHLPRAFAARGAGSAFRRSQRDRAFPLPDVRQELRSCGAPSADLLCHVLLGLLAGEDPYFAGHLAKQSFRTLHAWSTRLATLANKMGVLMELPRLLAAASSLRAALSHVRVVAQLLTGAAQATVTLSNAGAGAAHGGGKRGGRSGSRFDAKTGALIVEVESAGAGVTAAPLMLARVEVRAPRGGTFGAMDEMILEHLASLVLLCGSGGGRAAGGGARSGAAEPVGGGLSADDPSQAVLERTLHRLATRERDASARRMLAEEPAMAAVAGVSGAAEALGALGRRAGDGTEGATHTARGRVPRPSTSSGAWVGVPASIPAQPAVPLPLRRAQTAVGASRSERQGMPTDSASSASASSMHLMLPDILSEDALVLLPSATAGLVTIPKRGAGGDASASGGDAATEIDAGAEAVAEAGGVEASETLSRVAAPESASTSPPKTLQQPPLVGLGRLSVPEIDAAPRSPDIFPAFPQKARPRTADVDGAGSRQSASRESSPTRMRPRTSTIASPHTAAAVQVQEGSSDSPHPSDSPRSKGVPRAGGFTTTQRRDGYVPKASEFVRSPRVTASGARRREDGTRAASASTPQPGRRGRLGAATAEGSGAHTLEAGLGSLVSKAAPQPRQDAQRSDAEGKVALAAQGDEAQPSSDVKVEAEGEDTFGAPVAPVRTAQQQALDELVPVRVELGEMAESRVVQTDLIWWGEQGLRSMEFVKASMVRTAAPGTVRMKRRSTIVMGNMGASGGGQGAFGGGPSRSGRRESVSVGASGRRPGRPDRKATGFMQLQGFTKAMAGGSLKSALGAICSCATTMLHADRGTVFLLDKAKGVLESKFADGGVNITVKLGQGVVGTVAQTKQVEVINNVEDDERFKRKTDKSTGYVTRSMITAPLIDKDDEVVGVLQLLNKKFLKGADSQGFTIEDKDLIRILSGLSSVAIEATTQLEEASRVTDRFGRLLNVVTAMSESKGLKELITELSHSLCGMLSADRCTVFLLDSETQELWSQVATGKGMDSFEIRVKWGHGIAGEVCATGALRNVADAYESAAFDRSSDEKTGYRTRAVLAVPMRNAEGAVIGVMQAINKIGGIPEVFSEEDERLLISAASLASHAVTLNTAMAQADVMRGRMAEVLRTAKQMTGLIDVKAVEQTLGNKCKEIVPSDRCTVYLLDPKTRQLVFHTGDFARDHRARRGSTGNLREVRLPADEGIAGACLAKGSCVLVADAWEDSRFDKSADKASGYRTTSIVAAPIKNAHGVSVGVVELINRTPLGTVYTADDVEIVEALTAVGAVSLENMSKEWVMFS